MGAVRIAVVSGKGGVGKTTLSVALAKELSLTSKTLILDLDFFNRGLTGLLNDGESAGEVQKPDFLSDDDGTWTMLKVADQLYNLSYPDLSAEGVQKFATSDVNFLSEHLEKFVDALVEQFGFDCVVLDCHGGPDNSSFAACLFAERAILVSEPDRITFHGTLHFMRQLHRIGGNDKHNIQLLFNKVVPKHFTAPFLYKLYDEEIREVFEGRDLLGVFPLEIYLTKEFEKTPFLTEVFPYSLLAHKMRQCLRVMFEKDKPDLLTDANKSVAEPIQYMHKMSLGNTPWFLSIDCVMILLVACFVVFGASMITLEYFDVSHYYWDTFDDVVDDIRDNIYLTPMMIAGFVFNQFGLFGVSLLLSWFFFALYWQWLENMTRGIVYRLRKFKRTAISRCLLMFGMLLIPCFAMMGTSVELVDSGFDFEDEDWEDLSYIPVFLTTLVYLAIYVGQNSYFAYRCFVYEGQKNEGIHRLALVLGIVGLLFLSYIGYEMS